MTILKFVSIYPDEQSCRDNFRELREKDGVFCKKCKSKTHYWLKNKEQWQCTQKGSNIELFNEGFPLDYPAFKARGDASGNMQYRRSFIN